MQCTLSPNSITPTLRRSPQQTRTQITKVRDTNHDTNFHDLCPLWTLSRTFPIHCSGLNSIRATQMSMLGTCHELKHLDMSWWFVCTTFMICVGDFHQKFMISWFVTICVRDFHNLCLRLSPRGSFSESRHNGIWALPHTQLSDICCTKQQ